MGLFFQQTRLALVFLLFLCTVGCGKKDVNRRGELKLRGESEVSLKGKRHGDKLQKGIASWYGGKYHGRKTANGETYDMWKMTAAHKTIPFDTLVKVVNLDNGKEAVVRINDRGPFVRGRVIDLSRKAARALGVEATGIANVALYLFESGHSRGREPKPKPKPKPKPQREKPASIEGSYWTIQVGSFQEKQRAQNFAVQMESFSDHVVIVPNDGMYRVRVGRFRSKLDAKRLVDELKQHQINAWIVQQQ